ncbi:2-phospho-L-lactate guanylyltransferase [Labedaea rhizosphaerae]|uniref:Phosphoenolpyruvate guanylyltransferase n=1 Tax=Labedaea rhizosphaerae TaxID=598644 RepID=A0A4R6SD00_LABRH|nr:2-phospho-L-lactate guanylyltransferase [Labedaea rhizosphaerae]TDP97493.1 2-phospho-L-lactate guanylyltransferase [Labedaea rhizosphaerae]
MDACLDLVVPMKRLDRAKSRLRGAVPGGSGRHVELALALLLDTVTAARAADGVRSVLVVCEDERVPVALRGTGVDVVDERGLPGLNEALAFGARLLGEDGHVGALQADLPALRPVELAAAIAQAGGARAFCPDKEGTGTTLLLAGIGEALDPRFGPGSAAAHAGTGAVAVGVGTPGLRCDVDTAEDLEAACQLGVGDRTAALVCASAQSSPG